MASQAAVYVHAIAMLNERVETLTGSVSAHSDDHTLQGEQASLRRSLRLFRSRLRRTEDGVALGLPGR